uniref:Uncharacterized protein n=1 Tax=Arundo donax TaxID=35708 RepID=A0A0A9EK74_ARUDO
MPSPRPSTVSPAIGRRASLTSTAAAAARNGQEPHLHCDLRPSLVVPPPHPLRVGEVRTAARRGGEGSSACLPGESKTAARRGG